MNWKKFLPKVALWLVMVPVDFIMVLTAYPMSPIIALISMIKGEPPKWAWLWLTYDNPIDGDSGHLKRWADYVAKYPKWGVYCRRTAWLWRNKVYNFAYTYEGISVGKIVVASGNPNTESGKPGKEGYIWLVDENGYWCLFLFKHYTKNLAVRIYIGWKFKGLLKDPNGKIERSMFANFFSPFRIWTGSDDK
ncbi:g263 [Yersinia phage phiR1-37]|uniref:hypothetical protein n=1 Tax=Yersinia phage phiR1-37 TaxID=331278 RepID=UPI00022DBDB2|nr:hypothetical protein phiR1-37_gp263 [Yersinia phage phiR1-37]CCE26286.1 g263 [Yersinia phage phiR1-37]